MPQEWFDREARLIGLDRSVLTEQSLAEITLGADERPERLAIGPVAREAARWRLASDVGKESVRRRGPFEWFHLHFPNADPAAATCGPCNDPYPLRLGLRHVEPVAPAVAARHTSQHAPRALVVRSEYVVRARKVERIPIDDET